jgi:hypothetical protein
VVEKIAYLRSSGAHILRVSAGKSGVGGGGELGNLDPPSLQLPSSLVDHSPVPPHLVTQ